MLQIAKMAAGDLLHVLSYFFTSSHRPLSPSQKDGNAKSKPSQKDGNAKSKQSQKDGNTSKDRNASRKT